MKGFTSMIRREPIGIAGLIAPWNYLYMAAWKMGPALAAGNCVVIKPSELTPLTLLRFAHYVAEAEVFPPGVFNVVTGDGVPVGERIVANPDVGIVSLTGETSTGKLIMQNAAETLKRTHLELGGKAPVIVFDDADVSSAAEWVKIAGYFNSGRDYGGHARPRGRRRLRQPPERARPAGREAAGRRHLGREHRDGFGGLQGPVRPDHRDGGSGR